MTITRQEPTDDDRYQELVTDGPRVIAASRPGISPVSLERQRHVRQVDALIHPGVFTRRLIARGQGGHWLPPRRDAWRAAGSTSGR